MTLKELWRKFIDTPIEALISKIDFKFLKLFLLIVIAAQLAHDNNFLLCIGALLLIIYIEKI